MLEILLVQSLCNCTVKTKLAILAFLYCGEFVKNPIGKEILSFFFINEISSRETINVPETVNFWGIAVSPKF